MASRTSSLLSDSVVDFWLLRTLLGDPLRFIHGPSFVVHPSKETFSFTTTGIPLLADKVYLGT